ncbi:hypothetical protein AAC387_Pa04g1629 [Persea americana]
MGEGELTVVREEEKGWPGRGNAGRADCAGRWPGRWNDGRAGGDDGRELQGAGSRKKKKKKKKQQQQKLLLQVAGEAVQGSAGRCRKKKEKKEETEAVQVYAGKKSSCGRERE